MDKRNKITVFIFHGAYGSPDENWFHWLKKELEKLGCTVFIPAFPTPDNQSLKNWIDVFSKYMDKIDENTIFIGHSIAPAFILTILEQIKVKVKCSIFISGFIDYLNNENFDSLNRSFIDKDFNWVKIKNNCDSFIMYHSDNDPYVLISSAKKLSDKINIPINLVKNAGHFNSEAGYDTFELLLEDIKKFL